MADELRRFVYVSRSRLTPANEAIEIAVIRAVSSIHNREQGITGALIHAPGFFAQYIEGPRPALAALIWKIRRDHRHEGLNGIEIDQPKRVFRNWSFAYAGSASFISRRMASLHARPLDERACNRIVWFIQQFEGVEIQPGEKLAASEE